MRYACCVRAESKLVEGEEACVGVGVGVGVSQGERERGAYRSSLEWREVGGGRCVAQPCPSALLCRLCCATWASGN